MPRSHFWRMRRHDAIFVLALTVRWLATVLPRGPGLRLYGLLGALAYLALPRERSRTIAHLRYVYGSSWSERRIRFTARRVFVNLGMNLFDAIRLPRMSDDELRRVVTSDRFDVLLAANRKGPGPVAVSLHLGCFEMLLPVTARWGLNGFAVGQRLFDRRLDKLVAQARSGVRMDYVARDANPREVIRRLQRGMTFGVLIDQDTNVDGVFAHFLGRLAYTPSGAIRLALRYSIPVFVVTTRRVGLLRHHVQVQGPLELPAGADGAEALVRSVELVNGVLSDAIHQAPEQWVWMHRRWSRQPSDPRFRSIPSVEHYPAGQP